MRCERPVHPEGSDVALGCTLEAGHDEGIDPTACIFQKTDEAYEGQVILCAVCSSQVGDTSLDGTGKTICPQCGTTQSLSDKLLADEETDIDQPFGGAIVLCPMDQEQIDAPGWGVQTSRCPSCGLEFTVQLSAERVRQHSMF